MGSSEHNIVHPRTGPWQFTAREAEIMDAMCLHGSTKKIAAAIKMAEGTVHSHLVDIYEKMDCHDRTVAACRWTRWRLTGL